MGSRPSSFPPMLTRGEERLIHGLGRRKVRERGGLFLAEGIRVVEELLAAELPVRLALVSPSLEETERGRELAVALAAVTEPRRVDDGTLNRLAGTETPQGVLVVAEAPEADLDGITLSEPAVVLVLDGVQDPGNAGTLIRTAAAMGPVPVVCLTGTVDPWNPKAVRAAAGGSFLTPVVSATPEELLAFLDGQGAVLLGAAVDGEPLAAGRWSGRPVALVVGNEGAGLSHAMEAALDARVALTMRGRVESLNVSIAAAILLYLISEAR